MSIITLPTTITSPIDGTVVLMPHHPDFVLVPKMDLSDAVNYWMTSTIRSDGYSWISGTDGAPNTIQLTPGGVTVRWEYDFHGLGISGNSAGHVDRQGVAWPPVLMHAVQNVIIDGQGGRLYSADATKFDPGTITKGADYAIPDFSQTTVPGTVIFTNVQPPFTANQRARLLSGDTYLKSTVTQYSTNFSGGGANHNTSVKVTINDADEIVLLQGRVINPLGVSDTSFGITLDIPVQEQRRSNGYNQFCVNGPGSYLGVERDCMSRNIIVRNLTIEGPNTTNWDAVGQGVEEWLGVVLRACDGVFFEESVRMVNIASDFLNLGNTSQKDQPNGISTQAENVTFWAQCNVAGRHAVTHQGAVNLDCSRATFQNVSHWIVDSEPTNGGARMLGAVFGGACDPGYSMYTAHPLGFVADPPIAVPISQGPASNLIVTPYDAIDSRHQGSLITAAGVPDDTFTWRRLSPTLWEVSGPVAITGTVPSVIGPAALFRNISIDKLAVFSGNPQWVGDSGPKASGVELTGDTVKGENVIRNVVMEQRADSNVYTMGDIPIAPSTLKLVCETSTVYGNGVPTAVDPVARTITMPNSAIATISAKTFTAVTTTIRSRKITTATDQFSPSDRGRRITHPGLPDRVKIDNFINKRTVEVDIAATSTTTADAAAGNARFTFEKGPSDWGPFTVNQMRNIGRGKFGGSLVSYTNPDSPMLMFPNRTRRANVTKCMARASGGSPTTVQQTVADVTTFNGTQDLNVGNIAVFNNSGTVVVATSTGFAKLSFGARGQSPNRVRSVTWISGSGSIAVGAAIFSVTTHMVGHYDGAAQFGVLVGNVANNKWQDAYDDQAPEPTVTASIVLTIDDNQKARPTFTAVITFSDGRSVDKESIAFYRPYDPATKTGTVRGAAVCHGNTAVFTPWSDSPAGVEQTWYATWGNGVHGSWDTLAATSNGVKQFPAAGPAPTATTTTLVASPESPSNSGTPITLTATVNPTPDGGNVNFRVGTTSLGIVAVAAGVATLTGVTLNIGDLALTATYTGTSLFDPSTGSLSYTSNYVPPPDTDPPTVEILAPAPGDEVQAEEFISVVWQYSEPIGYQSFELTQGGVDVPGTIVENGNIRWFTTADPVAPGSYTATIGDFSDLSGNVTPGETWQFAAVAPTPSLALVVSSSAEPSPPSPASAPTWTATLTESDGSTPPGFVQFFFNGQRKSYGWISNQTPNIATYHGGPLANGSYIVQAAYSGQRREAEIWMQQPGIDVDLISRMADEGVTGVRLGIDMAYAFPSITNLNNGTGNFNEFILLATHARSLGLKVLNCVTYWPGPNTGSGAGKWMTDALYHQQPQTTTGMDQNAEMFRQAMIHCGALTDAWEIGNEINHFQFNLNPDITKIRLLMRKCVLAMRTASPNAYIIPSGPASTGSNTTNWNSKWDTGTRADLGTGVSPATYLDGIHHPTLGLVSGNSPGTAWVNAYATHGYTNSAPDPLFNSFENPFSHCWIPMPGIGDPAIFPNGFSYWRDIICAREGYDPEDPPAGFKPIWDTEDASGSFNTRNNGAEVWTETRQAFDIANKFNIWRAFPFSGPYIYFMLQDDPNGDVIQQDGGIYRSDGTPKLSRNVFRTETAKAKSLVGRAPVKSAPYVQVIGTDTRTTTTTSVSATPNPTDTSVLCTVSAHVTASGGFPVSPAPTVTFFDGATALATVTVDTFGDAVLVRKFTFVSTRTITARFNGDSLHQPSTSAPLALVVNAPVVSAAVRYYGGGPTPG